MFWKEDIENLVLSKRRKLTNILNNLDELENESMKETMTTNIEMVEKGLCGNANDFIKNVDADFHNIMLAYGKLRNMFVEYYYNVVKIVACVGLTGFVIGALYSIGANVGFRVAEHVQEKICNKQELEENVEEKAEELDE